MLTFISFWRAAAVVLNDLGSSAFYAGGIAEEAIGKSAPWFILGVMLFCVRGAQAVYVESCSMFTRGGVYRVVKEALGGTFAKVSVSALMFDYILTGPISGVSAGQYITGLLDELLQVGATHNWLPRPCSPRPMPRGSYPQMQPLRSSAFSSPCSFGGKTSRASKSRPAKLSRL